MRILDQAVYVGPSLYAHFPVIRLDVDLGELENWPSVRLGRGFTDGLVAALPGLREHGCSYGKPGGFIRRLTEDKGTWMGHILEHVAIELQNVAGESVTFGKTRSHGPVGHYYVIYQYEHEEVGLEAGRLGLTLLHSLLPPELRPEDAVPTGFDFAAERDEFIRYAQRRHLGPSTMALVRAAEDRKIPWMRLNEQSLIQFGHGRYQQRIQATVTSRTPHIAVELASDKEETNRILADLGLPVPRQRLVQREDDAVAAAERIGYPVVVKPYNANHGRGITIHISTAEEVRAAYAVAREHSRSVIVESFIAGDDHRMLVIDGQLVAVSKRVPGHVVGDGVRTIEQLVEEVNRDPRRGIGHEKVLTRLAFDHQAESMMARKGYTKDSVPEAGEQVFLRSTGNLSTGGTATDVTDVVHPDNIEMAVRAVKAVGLDVGGVDFLTTDITESYKEVGGAICEINAAPGFRMHMAPSEGRPRDVAGPVMDMLFPPGTPSRIPIAAVTGTNGKTTTARMLAHIQKLAGHHVGLTSTDGVYIDGQRTVAGDMTGPLATRMVLRDPAVDVAVLEIARGGLLRAGMGVRHCDVGAVLNVKADHLGLRGIGTLDQLAEVKRIVVEVARETAVLNADDPLCLKMADYTQAEHVCYVTMNPTHELVGEHIRAGGRGVVLESGMKGQMITIYDHGAHIPLLWTHLIPATLEGRALHNVQNAMFAAAMAFSMGLKLEDIRHGLRTFDTTFFQAPGRMNIYDEHPFKVILDYGHNPAAVEAMCELVDRLDVAGRRICVLAAPGDRRDEDIRDIGRIAAGRFDRYICRRDDTLRGRKPDEVPNILREALVEHGAPPELVAVIPDEQAAVEAALREAAPGDLVLIFADAITRSWKQVIHFQPNGDGRPAERPRTSRPEPAPPAE
ncbi:MAG TPA: cyanophycin synthetase, partial [Gemmatimonadales bacterium]|nr:cyanophycin synthetase [Gemmatimonadales bacterium]